MGLLYLFDFQYVLLCFFFVCVGGKKKYNTTKITRLAHATANCQRVCFGCVVVTVTFDTPKKKQLVNAKRIPLVTL